MTTSSAQTLRLTMIDQNQNGIYDAGDELDVTRSDQELLSKSDTVEQAMYDCGIKYLPYGAKIASVEKVIKMTQDLQKLIGQWQKGFMMLEMQQQKIAEARAEAKEGGFVLDEVRMQQIFSVSEGYLAVGGVTDCLLSQEEIKHLSRDALLGIYGAHSTRPIANDDALTASYEVFCTAEKKAQLALERELLNCVDSDSNPQCVDALISGLDDDQIKSNTPFIELSILTVLIIQSIQKGERKKVEMLLKTFEDFRQGLLAKSHRGEMLMVRLKNRIDQALEVQGAFAEKI